MVFSTTSFSPSSTLSSSFFLSSYNYFLVLLFALWSPLFPILLNLHFIFFPILATSTSSFSFFLSFFPFIPSPHHPFLTPSPPCCSFTPTSAPSDTHHPTSLLLLLLRCILFFFMLFLFIMENTYSSASQTAGRIAPPPQKKSMTYLRKYLRNKRQMPHGLDNVILFRTLPNPITPCRRRKSVLPLL